MTLLSFLFITTLEPSIAFPKPLEDLRKQQIAAAYQLYYHSDTSKQNTRERVP
jgi:hypothetical protein